MDTQTAGQYASVNGLNLYYEVHGTGQPLVIIHGGFGTVEMFAQLIPQLSEARQVIAVELQGHGHTADIDRPLSYEFMADDVAALLKSLGLSNADLLGYSLGGGVALQTVIRHPQRVRKLVVISAPCRSSGWYGEVLTAQQAINAEIAGTWVGSPMHQAYANVAPRPEDWTTLAAKMGQFLGREYDWSNDIPGIQSPVLIVIGDADGVRTAHAVEIFELLGGGMRDAGWDGSEMSAARLAVLPATTHYNILANPLLVPAVINFLDEPMPAAK